MEYNTNKIVYNRIAFYTNDSISKKRITIENVLYIEIDIKNKVYKITHCINEQILQTYIDINNIIFIDTV